MAPTSFRGVAATKGGVGVPAPELKLGVYSRNFTSVATPRASESRYFVPWFSLCRTLVVRRLNWN